MDRYDGYVADERGNGIAGVTVTVYDAGTTNPSLLFEDNQGTSLANPFNVDDQGLEQGEFFFYARNGRYDIVLSGTVSETRPDQVMFEPSSEGINYTYEIATTSPPSDRSIRFNNADLSLATTAYIDKNNYGGSDVSTLISKWYSVTRTRKDILVIKDPEFLTQASWDITDLVDSGAYLTLTLANHSGFSSYTNLARLGIWALLAGPDGSMTGPGSSGDNELPRFNGTGGNVLQTSGFFIDDAGRLLTRNEVSDPAVVGGIISALEYPPNADLDDVTDQGWHLAESAEVANVPGAGDWLVFTVGDIDWKQFAHRLDDPTVVYSRVFITPYWQGWERTTFDKATAAEFFAGGIDKLLTADLIETAAAEQNSLSDAATIAVDWDDFFNDVVTLTANRVLGNPTNGQPGTYREIRVKGNDGTARTLTFDTNYQTNNIASLTDITSAKEYSLSIKCKTTSKFIVMSALDYSD